MGESIQFAGDEVKMFGEDKAMWRLKYVICLLTHHCWIGSDYKYCVRCGKLEIVLSDSEVGGGFG